MLPLAYLPSHAWRARHTLLYTDNPRLGVTMYFFVVLLYHHTHPPPSRIICHNRVHSRRRRLCHHALRIVYIIYSVRCCFVVVDLMFFVVLLLFSVTNSCCVCDDDDAMVRVVCVWRGGRRAHSFCFTLVFLHFICLPFLAETPASAVCCCGVAIPRMHAYT